MEIEYQFAKIFLDHIGIASDSADENERLVRSFANIISERCGKAIYPEAGNSLALSVLTPKTAALAFDRVYRIPILNNPVPEEIGFYCATPTEILTCSLMLFQIAAEEAGIELPKSEGGGGSAAENEERRLRLLCSGFQKEFQLAPTIFYHAKDRMKKAFHRNATGFDCCDFQYCDG
jgi:hypothetical protein